jgi:protein-tyrosine-phosphatase
VAEAVFRKLSNNEVRSRGTEPDYIPVAESVQKAIKKLGYRRVSKNPRKLKKVDEEWADLIIVVADNVDLDRKIMRWKIQDTNQRNEERILEISKRIERRVKKLVRELN